MEGSSAEKALKAWIAAKGIEMKGKLKLIKNNEELVPELIKFEKQNIVKNYKIGILYWKEGQTENESFGNRKKKFFSSKFHYFFKSSL